MYRSSSYHALFPRLKERMDEEEKRLQNMLIYERKAWEKGYSMVAGVDEAGRGPLAGPVIAAAVILPPGIKPYGLNDSKKMTAKQREALYNYLIEYGAVVSWASVEPEEIDSLNIYRAAKKAMQQAVDKLIPKADFLLVDGPNMDLSLPGESIIKGDAKSLSIAGASVVAKVERDRIMEEYDLLYPEYGFAKHKGYPTPEHYHVLAKIGPCKIHRKSFRLLQDA